MAGYAFQRLRADLKANRFRPGERLRLQDMTSIYAVGTAPLREALSRLAESGLVVQIDQRGFRVAEASLADLRQVVEARRFLEVRAFQDAIVSGDSDWESQVVACFHRFSQIANARPETPAQRALWEERHTAFHRILVQGCPNQLLKQFWSVAFDQAERYRRLALELLHWSANELRDHKRLLDAVLARDEIKASELMYKHIGQSSKRLLASIVPIVEEASQAGERQSKPR